MNPIKNHGFAGKGRRAMLRLKHEVIDLWSEETGRKVIKRLRRSMAAAPRPFLKREAREQVSTSDQSNAARAMVKPWP